MSGLEEIDNHAQAIREEDRLPASENNRPSDGEEACTLSRTEDEAAADFGLIEAFDGFLMSGWFFSTGEQTRELTITFDGNVICELHPHLSRRDVVKVHADAPEHSGFFVDLTQHALLDKSADYFDLQARLAVVSPTGFALKHGYEDPYLQRRRDQEALYLADRFKGSFDGVVEGIVHGWAIGPTGMKLAVSVAIDGVTLGSVVARNHRQDVGEKFGDADCGFAYRVPLRFRDGHLHNLRCTYAVSGRDLPGSPKDVVLTAELDERAKRLDVIVGAFGQLQKQIELLRRQLIAEASVGVSFLANYQFYQDVVQAGAATISRLRKRKKSSSAALFSIVMPTYKSDLALLAKAIDSVVAQTDSRWELVISDSASSAEVRDYLKSREAIDPRIRVHLNDDRLGISENTNAALRKTKGKYIGFMDHDDEIAPEAISLFRVAFETGEYDLLYSDEDKIDSNGNFVDPHYKTAFNIDLLLCMNYICHLVFVAREALFSTDLLRSAYDGAQDWDLLLQLTHRLDRRRIGHIPRVLYHWRMIPGSTAASIGEKSYAVDAGLRAVATYLEDTRAPATASLLTGLPYVDVAWRPTRGSKVSLIIPTKDRIDLVTNCINSVFATAGQTEIEVLIVDNNSSAASNASFRAMCADPRIRVLRYESAFNYSAINNFAARHATGQYLLLLNNDVFFTQRGWLESMLGIAEREDVGAVGLKLLYPDNTVQHCGVVLGNGGVAGHAFSRLAMEEAGYFARAACTQEVSALTAACLLVRSEVFWKVDGLDEQQLAVAFNDVDLCLKIQQAGFRNILLATKFAYHAESISRGHEDTLEKIARFNGEINAMVNRWGAKLQSDRFYSPNFDLGHACYKVIDLPAIADQETTMVVQSLAR